MKRMTITDEANTLYKAFQEKYSYIIVSIEVVEKFVRTRFYQSEKDRKSVDYMLDLMQDWILARQEQEEVVL